MVLSFKRLNDRVRIEMRYGTIETPDGSVLRLDTRTLASDQELRTFGDVINGKMTLTLEGSGQPQQSTISWGPEVRGPYAAEQSLSRQPMKPGESRSLRMFVPDLNKICDVTLAAKAFEEVQLGGGRQAVAAPGRAGRHARRQAPARVRLDPLGRLGRAGAQEPERRPRGHGHLPDHPRGGDRARRRVQAEPDPGLDHQGHPQDPQARGDPRHRLPPDPEERRPRQARPGRPASGAAAGADPNTSILEVKSVGAADGTSEPGQVDEQFLRPNSLVTSEDPVVRSLAVKAVGDAVDPWEKAVKIEHWVARNLKDKNFKTAFAPASEVARNLSGDCTEHGVLVAAMCRAAGVPARVAVGLVYADHLGGFGFHLWNEVYVNRRWVAIDAAFDQSTVDAVHIKLGDTSLDGVSPYEAFLPVVRVLGKMTLEPLEIR